MEAQRISGIWPKDPCPHVHLVELYVAMGKHGKALKLALETEPLLKPPADPRGKEDQAAMIAMYEPQFRPHLYAAMADAYEGLGLE